MKILILNGANLNLLGTREPEIYGSTSMEDILQDLQTQFAQVEFEYFQSNFEGKIAKSHTKGIDIRREWGPFCNWSTTGTIGFNIMNLSTCVSACVPIPIHLPIYPTVDPFIHPSIHLSIDLSIHLKIYPANNPSI